MRNDDAAAACFGIALNYEQGRMYDKALAYLYRSCELYEAMPGRQGEAMSHMAIGRIHHTLGAEDLAERHFQQALDMAAKLGARATVAITRRSTKEIARLMCVTPKSAEVYRTRIGKKLMLTPGENLCAFLHALEHGMRARAA